MSFIKQKSTLTKKKGEVASKTPKFIYQDPNPEIYIVTDKLLSRPEIAFFKYQLQLRAGYNVEISVIYSWLKVMSFEEVKKNRTKNLLLFSRNFDSLIPPNSKILTLGGGLQNLTKDKDVTIEAFYDIIWNKQSFYHPPTKSEVFPLPKFRDFTTLGTQPKLKDNFEMMFFKKQLDNILGYEPERTRLTEPNKILVNDTTKFFKEHSHEEKVALDIETNSLDYLDTKIRCVQMSFDGRTGYYLPWKDINKEELNDFLKDKYQIGANYKFDVKNLRHNGISNAKIDFCTLTAGHMLNEMRSNSLKTHAWIYTKHGGYDEPLELYKVEHPKIKNYDEIPRSVMFDYAVMDAIVTFQVYEAMLEHLAEDPQLEKYVLDFVMPKLNMYLDIEMTGMPVDLNKVENEITPYLEKVIKEAEERIFQQVGVFNINSSTELAKKMEFEWGWQDIGNRSNKTQLYSTDKEALKEWGDLGYSLAYDILEYKSFKTMLTNFAGYEKTPVKDDSYLEGFDKKTTGKPSGLFKTVRNDGLLHPTFWAMLANTHRNRTSDPNFQNFPHHGDRAKLVRKAFQSLTPDYYVIDPDFGGLQLRIAAILSGDKTMREIFSTPGGDIHSRTCVPLFHKDMTVEDFKKVKKEEPYATNRFLTKGVVFGFLFGRAASSFYASDLRKMWTEDQAYTYCIKRKIPVEIDNNGNENWLLTAAGAFKKFFFETYPGLPKFIEDRQFEGMENGFIRYRHGGRRLTPYLLYTTGADENRKRVSSYKNIAINSPVQNFESVVVNRAMYKCYRYFKDNGLKSRLYNQVHDEVTFYIHKQEVHIIPIIKGFLEESYDDYEGVIMETEGSVSDSFHNNKPTYWGYGLPLDLFVKNNFDYDKTYEEVMKKEK